MMIASPIPWQERKKGQRGVLVNQQGKPGENLKEAEENRTGLDVGPVGKAERVTDDALGGHHVVVRARDRLALAPRPSHRPDPVRVAEAKDAVPGNHGRAGVGARGVLHAFADGAEDVVGVDAELARLLERVGEEVEEELRVGRGVNVAVTVVVEVIPQVVGVGQVAVLVQRGDRATGLVVG